MINKLTMNPFECLYYIGYTIKKFYATKDQKKLPIRVISIGNLTVGGTGKTPATIAIAEGAKSRGFSPCILTRGYKGRTKGPCFVSKGDGPILSEKEAGDEPLLMAERLKGVPVTKGKSRYEAGMFALSALPPALSPDLFILDDGFQHWGLFRDKDILLIDSTNPFGNKRLLPLGPLREPLHAMSRADIIVITKTHPSPSPRVVVEFTAQGERVEGKGGGDRSQRSIVDGLVEEIKKHNIKAPVFFAEHRPSKFITAHGVTLTLEWAEDKGFYGFCGIGNPESFKKTLLSAGIDLRGFKAYRDHYRYLSEDLEMIRKDAQRSDSNWIVTTEKDIMRLRGLDLPENFVSLSIDFIVDDKFYEEVFNFEH